MSATLAGARPLPYAVAQRLTAQLDAAARQAIATGEAVRLEGEVLVVPDVLIVEAWAQGHSTAPTPAVSWPDDTGELAGRRCLVYRLA